MKHTIYLTLTIAILAIHAGAGIVMLPVPVPAEPQTTAILPVPAGAQTTRTLPIWVRTDAKGFRWDINYTGRVNDGNRNAYDGGMSLRLSGNPIPTNGSRPVKVAENKQEIILSPQLWNSVHVTRRIYVDTEGAYCRWIDVFENTSSKPVTLNVEYYTNLGNSIRTITSTSATSLRLEPKNSNRSAGET